MIAIIGIITLIIIIALLVDLAKKAEADRIEQEKLEKKYLAKAASEEQAKRLKTEKLAEEERLKAEKLAKQAEEKRILEEKLKTKCLICKNCSMGDAICNDCWNRAKVLKKELPLAPTSNYENIIKFREDLMLKILYSTTKFEKETTCIKLLSIANILKEKYYDSNAFKYTYDFFNNVNDKNKDEIIDIYELKNNTISNKESFAEEEITTDFRQKFPKPYRCKDGDYVRSKSEREIDDFFFDNRIWHIYEHEYTHPITGKTAETDFFLPDYNLYIEYFGMTDADYLKKRDEKISMYQSDTNINFEYLTYENDNNIYQKLKEICFKYSISIK